MNNTDVHTADQEKEPGYSLSELCMLPFALIAMLLSALFGKKLDWLRQQRRSRPMPKNFQAVYPNLRLAEWPVAVMLGEGSRQILDGRQLDLSLIKASPEPPDSFHCPMPSSAFAMHRRIEFVTAFMADPERFIRRWAARLARREAARLRPPESSPDRPGVEVRRRAENPRSRDESDPAQRVRAPP